jgi:hypothetical protein
MNQELRIKRLLNKIKRRYDLVGPINVKIIKTETKGRYKPLIVTNSFTRIATIHVYPNNTDYKFEKVLDKTIEHILAQELIHCIVGRMIIRQKEKNPENLRMILRDINDMIDYAWKRCTKKRRKIKKKR